MKKLFTLLVMVGLSLSSNAQDITNTLGTDGDFIIESTTGGLLIPRMTQVERDAIVSPTTSLMIYQTDNTTGFYYYDGSTWVSSDGAKKLDDLTDALSTDYQSIFIGNGAGNVSSTAGDNSGFGYASLGNITTGIQNTALGSRAGTLIESGSNNIMIGYAALASSVTASNEINIGKTIYATGINTTNAKVGIGNAHNAPTATLDVDGDVKIKDVLHLTPSAAPSSPSEGDIYMDSTTHKLMVYDGTNWQSCW